ncbi:MAG TPA: FUN14 domain-containing protein [Nitrososphaeraceae archaeon]|nr:FUN14 domain-containing protein [Nitrososphaeraceae archaeon]
MSSDNVISYAATMGGGFFIGVLIGYALKKVIKMVAVIFGIFLAGLAYLQTQQIANINWNKLQTVSEGTITTVSNTITQIPAISSNADGHAAAATSSLAITSFGIPLTGSMSVGFTIGFMKG